MTEFGYGDEIYKLAMLSHRQREELVERLFVLPGHKSKLDEFFKIIDQLYPKNIIMKTLDNAA